jgi:hypothetical protein
MRSFMICTPHPVQVIKFRRMRWAGHVVHLGERGGVHRVWWGNMRKRDHLEDPGVDGRIILRWVFRKWNVRAWIGSIWLKIWTSGRDL